MSTTTDRVLATLGAQVHEVNPDVDPNAVIPGATLEQLGCSSIDRAEIVVLTMEQLGVTLEPGELAGVRDVASLVDVLVTKL
jgi:polyketide biosynthesis acyl carrier protein